MSDEYEKNYMTDASDTRWVKLAYANLRMAQSDQRITDLERRNGELEKLRVVACKMANSLYNWKQQDWAATRSEKMDALVLEHDTLTRSLRAAPTQHPQGESNEQ